MQSLARSSLIEQSAPQRKTPKDVLLSFLNNYETVYSVDLLWSTARVDHAGDTDRARYSFCHSLRLLALRAIRSEPVQPAIAEALGAMRPQDWRQLSDEYADDLNARELDQETYLAELDAATALAGEELLVEVGGGLDTGSAIAADLLPRAFGQAGEFPGDVFSGM